MTILTAVHPPKEKRIVVQLINFIIYDWKLTIADPHCSWKKKNKLIDSVN